ncbi:MAG: hypothetical protein R6U68_06840 [Desulfobacteraceae bacterium]
MLRISPGRFLILFCFMLSGCSGLQPSLSPEMQAKAVDLTRKIENNNNQIKTCRGKGWLTLLSINKVEKFQFAFVCDLPGKIRLTLLSSGMPVETIAANGEKVTFVSHTGEHKPYTVNSKNPSLEKMGLLPVRVRQIIALLAGRMPLLDFDTASVFEDKANGTTTLVLKKKWKSRIQKIFMNARQEIVKFDMFESWRTMLYSVSFSDFENFNSHVIPTASMITDASGRQLNIRITEYHPNIKIKPSVFTLTEL